MFKASAQLEFDVQDASLRQTRKRVEAELADIQVGGGSGVSATLSRDVQAATDGSSGLSSSIAAAQLEQLEEINDNLEKMAVSGGGGGGGPASTALDLALLKRVGGAGGAAAGGGVLSGAGKVAAGAVGGVSALGAGTIAAGVGVPAAALYGILREDSANYDVGAQLERNRENGQGVITPDQGGTEQLNQRLNSIEVDAPAFLEDPTLQVPPFLEDPTLDVPGYLQDLSLDVPSALRDPPQIGFDVPPALQDLFGGGGTPAEPTGPGDGVDLSTGFPSRGSGGPNLSLDDIGFDIDVDLQGIQRDIQRAIEDEFRAASIQREMQELIQDQLRREFVP